MHTAAACVSRLPSGSSSGRLEEEAAALGAGVAPKLGASKAGALPAAAQPARDALASRRCVVEHQGATRIVHQPDGSIICEPIGFTSGAPTLARSTMSLHNRADSAASGGVAGDGVAGDGHSSCVLGMRTMGELRDMLITGVLRVAQFTMGFGAMMGLTVAIIETSNVLLDDSKVDVGKVVRKVNQVVTCCVLGTLAGAVAVPTVTVLGLLRTAVRPVLCGAAVHGIMSWVTRHHVGAAAILKKLQSGDLLQQVEVLRRLVARLEASARFCAQFKRLAGVEVLLGLLSQWLDVAEQGSATPPAGAHASLTARALADLSKQGDAVDTMVEMGGVPVLLHAISYSLAACSVPGAAAAAPGVASLPSSLVVAGPMVAAPAHGGAAAAASAAASAAGSPSCAGLLLHATAALARVASGHAVAQQLLASELGAAPLAVSVLKASTARNLRGATEAACDALRGHAIALTQALALEPLGKVALGQVGGVEALAAALLLSSPWTQGHEAAAAALHTLVRGDADNQRRLAALAPAGLSASLHRALAASSTGANGGGSSSAPVVVGAPGTPSALVAAAGMAGTQATAGGGGGGSRALSPQDCHWHRADLLALSNVIARYNTQALAQPQPQGATSGGGGNCPSAPSGRQTSAGSVTATSAAAASGAAAHPVATLAQRLGLRRPAPPAAALLPAPGTARASLDEAAAAAALPLPVPMLAAVSTTATHKAIEGVAALVLSGDVVATLSTPTSGAAVAKGVMPPSSPESDDWEQDCSLPVEQPAAMALGPVAPSVV